MPVIIIAIAAALLLVNLCLELKRDLMMFQQNSYRIERYRRWLSESGDSTSIWRLGGLVVFFIGLSTLSHPYGAAVLGAIFAAAGIWQMLAARYKKPLVWTPRAIRIYSTALALAAALTVALVFICDHSSAFRVLFTVAMTLLGCYCGSHLIIAAAGIILQPLENAINRGYYRDARRILASMPDLRIIGVTGSYGKTSTKHFLYKMLARQYDTVMTPGNFNTTLGVIRTIRENLKPYNEVFIVEMGAKLPGDIREICELVHPTMGIITAVGPQHLESFKTIERVQGTKFELADALPADGLIIVNNDFEKIADRPVTNTRCARYTAAGDTAADYRATDIHYTPAGTTFTIEGPDGWHLELHTRLMGECNVSDLLAAAIAARAAGVTDDNIRAAVAAIEPVEHRLSVKTTPGGITILDDAYNSNPVGSRMALEVLGTFGDRGRRIVITPGMIELGAEQHRLNYELGRTIADNADIAIIVGRYNREALVGGIKETPRLPDDAVYTPDTFAEAQQILAGIACKGDTVLYENDLPDTFK